MYILAEKMVVREFFPLRYPRMTNFFSDIYKNFDNVYVAEKKNSVLAQKILKHFLHAYEVFGIKKCYIYCNRKFRTYI